MGCDENPSGGIVDSQSVKTSEEGVQERDYNAGTSYFRIAYDKLDYKKPLAKGSRYASLA